MEHEKGIDDSYLPFAKALDREDIENKEVGYPPMSLSDNGKGKGLFKKKQKATFVWENMSGSETETVHADTYDSFSEDFPMVYVSASPDAGSLENNSMCIGWLYSIRDCIPFFKKNAYKPLVRGKVKPQ